MTFWKKHSGVGRNGYHRRGNMCVCVYVGTVPYFDIVLFTHLHAFVKNAEWCDLFFLFANYILTKNENSSYYLRDNSGIYSISTFFLHCPPYLYTSCFSVELLSVINYQLLSKFVLILVLHLSIFDFHYSFAI